MSLKKCLGVKVLICDHAQMIEIEKQVMNTYN